MRRDSGACVSFTGTDARRLFLILVHLFFVKNIHSKCVFIRISRYGYWAPMNRTDEGSGKIGGNRDSDMVVPDLLLRYCVRIPIVGKENFLEIPGSHLKISSSVYNVAIYARKDDPLMSPACKR